MYNFDKRVLALSRKIQSLVKNFHRIGGLAAGSPKDVGESIDRLNEDFEDDFNVTEAIARSLLPPNASFDGVSRRMSVTRERYLLSKSAAEQSLGKI